MSPHNAHDDDDELRRYIFGPYEDVTQEDGRGSKAKNTDKPHCNAALRKTSSAFPGRVDLVETDYSKSKEINSRNAATKRQRVLCDLCQKSFFDKSTLNRHIASYHEKRRPAVCPHCNKSFSKNSIVKQHIRVRSIQVITLFF